MALDFQTGQSQVLLYVMLFNFFKCSKSSKECVAYSSDSQLKTASRKDSNFKNNICVIIKLRNHFLMTE